MPDQLQDQIKTARDSGYSDDDIINHLSQGSMADKIKTAKTAGYASKDILAFLQSNPTNPNTPSNTLDDKRGTPNGPPTLSVPGMFQAGKDMLEGAGSGMFSTAQGIYNLAHKAMSGITPEGPFSAIPEAPDFLKRGAAATQYDPQGKPVAPSGAFNAGRTAEQVGEFFLPSGIVGDAAKGAEAMAGAGTGLGTLARIGTQATGDALASGGVSMAQTGGDIQQSATAAILSGASSGLFNTVSSMLQYIPMDKLYLSKLNFPERFRGERVEDIADMAIKEGILISKGGANRIAAIENLQKADRDALINQHLGDLVDVDIVKGPLQHMVQDANWLGKPRLAAQIQKEFDNFLSARGAQPAVPPSTTTIPGPNPKATLTPAGMPQTIQVPGTPAVPAKITVGDAIKAKDLFQKFAQNMYGKDNLSKAASDKLIAAGLNEALGTISPAYREANQDIQNSKLLKQAILKYIQSNPKTFFNPTTAIMALYHAPAALAYGALSSPFVRSALAIYGTKAINAAPAIGQNVGRLAASGASALSPVPQPPNQEPQQ